MRRSRWTPTHARLVVAWVIGFPTLFLMDVHDGFGSLLLLSGLLLIWSGVVIARDPGEAERFSAALYGPRSGASMRWAFASGLIVIGAGFTVGGVLGVLALLGLYEYP